MSFETIWVQGTELLLHRGPLRTAEVVPECYSRMPDVEALSAVLKRAGHGADLLKFGQRCPDVTPRGRLYSEHEDIAVATIDDYAQWRDQQISRENRKNIRKAQRKGIEVRPVAFDAAFMHGVHRIYNESAVRQGKPFGHYGKPLDRVTRELSTYNEHCEFFGAFHEEVLVGFIKLFFTEHCASTMQVISTIEHRDRKPTNALIAAAVERCAERGVRYLQYGEWSEGGLGDFKRYNGFERMSLPVYYAPLTARGRVALKLSLHHGIRRRLPTGLRRRLAVLRSRLYRPGSRVGVGSA